MKKLLLFTFSFLTIWIQKVHSQENIPFQITSGFNADVIANGSGSALTSTTVGVDVVNFCFMAANFQPTTAAPPAYALPVNGQITNVASPGVNFQMGNYTGNNSLRLPSTNSTGTITFGNPMTATKLYVLVTAGSGISTVTASIKFADNSTQVITNNTAPDWFNSNTLPVVNSGFGRVNRTTNAIENPSGNPRLYQMTLNISPANQNKLVTGIQFTKTSSGEGVFNAFAVTAETTACQAPASPTAAANQAFCGAATLADLTATGLDNASILWYATATSNAPISSNTALATGTYYVAQLLNDCESPRMMVNVTVTPVPLAPEVTSQTFCGTALVEDLSANGLANATILWYETLESETALAATTEVTTGVYFVSQMINSCESERAQVGINVLEIPAQPTADAQTFCGEATVSDLMVSEETTDEVNWYLNDDAIAALDPTTALVSGTYYVSQSNVAGCESEKLAVSITVVSQPAMPVADEQSFCGEATVADLLLTEEAIGDLNWFDNMDAVETMAANTVLVSGTYYVSQTVEGCESERTALIVNVYEIPATPVYEGVLTFNDGTTLADIEVDFLDNAMIQWYVLDSENNFVPIDATSLITETTYYVSQSLNGCESALLSIEIDSVLSANDFEQALVRLYPNPVFDWIFISGLENIENAVIINMLGQTILEINKPQEASVDAHNLKSGAYLLRIQTTNGSIQTLRFIKQ